MRRNKDDEQSAECSHEQNGSITRTLSKEEPEMKQKFRSADLIITEKLPSLFQKAAPPHICGLMDDFRLQYEKFKEMLSGLNAAGGSSRHCQQSDLWNREKDDEVFSEHFKRLFRECRHYYAEKMKEADKDAECLQQALVQLGHSGETAVYMEHMKYKREMERSVMMRAEKEMIRLQNEFFGEIKKAADEAGIPVPAPDDIDVMEELLTDPVQILGHYSRKHGRNVSRNMNDMVRSMFIGITPAPDAPSGDIRYGETVRRIIGDLDFPEKDEILFGSDCNYYEFMKNMLKDTTVSNSKLL